MFFFDSKLTDNSAPLRSPLVNLTFIIRIPLGRVFIGSFQSSAQFSFGRSFFYNLGKLGINLIAIFFLSTDQEKERVREREE